ncbi:hypothetical protein GOBAR_AA26726 [Gossypium barbadense]|uniref:Lipin N-terminal domain-containing protein n=1 Tax=Gossypium barbadense TaxID=3634 RepID=A0A2P5WS82_GOSBA|nr:hypothetical protein GOBAR_AA26726 [Gossypium barbadense]
MGFGCSSLLFLTHSSLDISEGRGYAVGRLGSYISRGVYTVSGPFHPFGGAVDIIVVEQPDGTFKTSPWYVRFGKFQGVLKTR